jgi:DNA-binding GntR family transcriptional regulator
MGIRYGSVTDAVVEALRDKILRGELRHGEWLKQDDLAKELEVSIVPVREALRQLQAEGLVVSYPRRGARVAPLDESEFEELYIIREELAVLACRWVAEDFSRLPLEKMRGLLGQIEVEIAGEDSLALLRLTREFCFTLFETTGKRHLLRLLSSAWDASMAYRRYFSEVTDLRPERFEHYRAIYRACERQDAEELTRSMRELFTFARQQFGPFVRQSKATRTGSAHQSEVQ